MRAVFFIFVGLFVLAAANDAGQPITRDEWDESLEKSVGQGRGLILNSQAKKALRNVMEQMPCGWPDLGIPPLAPYTNADLNLQMSRSAADSILQFIRFRFDGLDQMDIKKLKVSYTFNKKVKYHFVFKQLKATAHILNTDTSLDLMRALGLSVRYEGSGPLEFILENLSIQGQFKYKMPFLWGSIKIYKFEAKVTLGGVTSNIGGILGNGKLNRYINEQLENFIPDFINGNQNEISAHIEDVLVPRVNAYLKGHKVWWLLGQVIGSSNKCYPTPAPWLAME
ncbi:uncharacterized protein LOC101460765 [Ceratitis capitata]|uniref:(Mediterranean fruit fly) hypothetical protein n=2 Tax=Ceratitis capitata TaxID=7213 RepID=A0A811UET5_CERCA|nr:uncharacterized protein LOC101460765 [Ceratitis capitata]CAD6997374.1 unnamed protein product [Ceratitis capitata]